MAGQTDHFLSFENEPSAEAIAELLRGQGVPATVEIRSPVPGLLENIRIIVPKALEHRARWLLRSADVSDDELDFLATGELGAPGNRGS
jgi:hypothetical protein